MKRFIVALSLISVSLLLSGVTFHQPEAATPVLKKYSPSCGYTIVEYGVGIDCNGDTVRIEKKHGAQILVNS
jgi:hypothetical protein